MLTTVLVPLNLSESPDEICALVSFLRHFETTRIYLCTVVSSSIRARHQAEKKLQELQRSCGEEGMEILIDVQTGPPAVAIIRQSLAYNVDYIAFPWERKSVLQHALMGSITKDVVRLTDKPVLIYKQWFLKKNDELTTLLFSSDLSSGEEAIVPYLTWQGLAARNLIVLNVGDRAPDPAAEQARISVIEGKINGIVERCGGSFETIEHSIVIGKPDKVIPRLAQRSGADMILIGKQSDSSTRQKVLGSTAENIVHRARCSVLVIPANNNGEVGYEKN